MNKLSKYYVEAYCVIFGLLLHFVLSYWVIQAGHLFLTLYLVQHMMMWVLIWVSRIEYKITPDLLGLNETAWTILHVVGSLLWIVPHTAANWIVNTSVSTYKWIKNMEP